MAVPALLTCSGRESVFFVPNHFSGPGGARARVYVRTITVQRSDL